MESCRRIDEWELIFEQLGSLERIPHLAHGADVEDQGGVALTVDEWRGIVHIDGRADINTIIRDCGFDRFHGAKVLYDLYSQRPHLGGRPPHRRHRQGRERRRAGPRRHLL